MFCHKCGAPNDDQAVVCGKCGAALQKPRTPTTDSAPQYPTAVQYAGFWRRFAAALIDGLLLGSSWFAVFVILGVVYNLVMGQRAHDWSDSTQSALGYMSSAATIIAGWLYYALMERSAKQATLGKMALGIMVTDMNGQRVSFGRATGRHFGRLLSSLLLCIGYIIIAFTEKKQGLHDIMANCLVVVKRPSYPMM